LRFGDSLVKETPMSKKDRPLTAKRKLFVDEYLIDFNATRAAKAAGYSAHSAAAIGSRLASMPDVKAAIEARQTERVAQLGLACDKVLEQLAQIAFASLADHVHTGPDGGLRVDVPRLIREQSPALSDMTVDSPGEGDGDGTWRVTRVRIKAPDRRAALVALARHLPPSARTLPAGPVTRAAETPPGWVDPGHFEPEFVKPPVYDAQGNIVWEDPRIVADCDRG
jgi:phage terminase small subunit